MLSRFLVLLLLVIMPFYSHAKPAGHIKPYPLTQEDKATLTRVEAYLTGIHTITAQFTQSAPNGDLSNGMFYLQRPGKLRMEYAPPMPVLMVAASGDIVYYDKELDQVTHISLESTLVGFLAQEDVKFDKSVIITDMERAPDAVRVSLVQTKRPHDGTLTLEFSDHPMAIRNMIVTDSSGQTTTVSLNNARFNLPLDHSIFVFKDPHLEGRRGKNVVK